MDPQAFAACLQRFALELGSAARRAGVVAIDGEGLRAALAGARSATPLALVNAFASDCGLVLGQIGTGAIAAMRELLEFPGSPEPVWMEFFYQAFVIGCAFASSDVNVTTERMRRVVVTQGVVGFFFNAIILALAIAIAANLF